MSSAAALGEIGFDAVEVDDCFSDPNGDVRGTTLGPRWPEFQLSGAIYLEQRFCDRLPAALRPALPPKFMSGRPYEYATVLYWPGTGDPRAGRRYAGHHAEVLEERGSLARVAPSSHSPGFPVHRGRRACTRCCSEAPRSAPPPC